MNNELLTEREVEAGYGLKGPWLRRCRRERRGIPFLRVGRMVRYRKEDVERFLDSCRVDMSERRLANGNNFSAD